MQSRRRARDSCARSPSVDDSQAGKTRPTRVILKLCRRITALLTAAIRFLSASPVLVFVLVPGFRL